MDTSGRKESVGETDEEFRVKVKSKNLLTEQMEKYKEVLKTTLHGVTDVEEETRRALLQELLSNFEAAVQENVLVNGLSWEEAPDHEDDEVLDVEGVLDNTIVETTWKRRTHPKQILPHVIHSLKAERRIMELYEVTVKPQEFVRDTDQETVMADVSAAAPGSVRQTAQVLKSFRTLQNQVDGLAQVLDMKPSQTTLEVQREVFGQSDPAPPSVSAAAARSGRPMRSAVEEAVATGCYDVL